mmetsp:Transcript_30555/g.83970  ORF Transcript_30555/g.83970 Transcript_30555/m.83970 type:complete len:388 (+) Transcript_30555:125-1288(+)
MVNKKAIHQDPSLILERVHHVIHEQVSFATESIAHLEKTWTHSELTKRIVRYIYKSACNEALLSLPFEEVAEQLIVHAMHSYNASCGEKTWFFEIDLSPAFCAAVLELVRASGQRGATYERIQEIVVKAYEDKLDEFLLTKAMWEAVERSFKDNTVRNKIFASLQKTYQPALDETRMDARPKRELDLVEDFLRRWLESSMARAWSAVEGSEQILTETTVGRLFQNLLAPFGSNHPFSCIPQSLTQDVGPPPRKWAFVGKTVKVMFDKWRRDAYRPAAKRRKGSSADDANEFGGVFDAFQPNRRAAVQKMASRAFADDDDDEALGAECDEEGQEEGHPQCTSAEDCIGSQEEKLVQHIFNGSLGDIYCCKCWESFLLHNPTLEGEMLE